MAKTRMVNTRFWNDTFISQLDPIEKLLFIYFITNGHTNICGIYELPLKIAAIETGIDATMFEKIFPRLEEKIVYIDGWVCMKNFPKHQSSDNPKVRIGIKNELKLIPSHIIEKAIAYGYPMVDSSHSDSDSDLDSDSLGEETSPKEEIPSFEEYMSGLGMTSCEIEIEDGVYGDTFTTAKGSILSVGKLKEHQRQYDRKYGKTHQEGSNLANGEGLESKSEVIQVIQLFGYNPAHVTWKKNKTQLGAINELLDKLSVQKIAQLLETAKEMRKVDKYAPEIDTPYELLTKMIKIKNRVEKPGNVGVV